MPTVDVYTPRKVTDQNKATLPSTHDQTKRISYMQVHLKEDEMAEAIRNYIRRQMPILDNDEMPVVFIAGRGDNGHSAQVTIQAATITVQSPERPTDAIETFDEANKTASERNAAAGITSPAADTPETPVTEAPETSSGPETAEDTPIVEESTEKPDTDGEELETPEEELPFDPDTVESPEITEEPLAEVKDERDDTLEVPAEEPTTTRKASSLFSRAPTQPAKTKAAPAAKSPAAKAEAPAAKPKSKSIFDNL